MSEPKKTNLILYKIANLFLFLDFFFVFSYLNNNLPAEYYIYTKIIRKQMFFFTHIIKKRKKKQN